MFKGLKETSTILVVGNQLLKDPNLEKKVLEQLQLAVSFEDLGDAITKFGQKDFLNNGRFLVVDVLHRLQQTSPILFNELGQRWHGWLTEVEVFNEAGQPGFSPMWAVLWDILQRMPPRNDQEMDVLQLVSFEIRHGVAISCDDSSLCGVAA